MAIGVVFSGIFIGLMAAAGAMFAGLSIWIAAMLYPIFGTLGAAAFIYGFARKSEGRTRFATFTLFQSAR